VVNRRAFIGLALAVLVTAAFGLGVALALGHDKTEGHGPLVLPVRTEAYAWAPVPMRTPVSYGLLSVVNRSGKTMTIERASLVKPGHGIELLGAYALPVPNSRQIGLVLGFDKNPQGRALRGLKLAPHTRVQIILGMRVIEPGRFEFDAIKLDYNGDGASFRDSYPLSGRLCSPEGKYVKTCSDRAMTL
jgi:hypothetical protein